jgi:hypothetical protein
MAINAATPALVCAISRCGCAALESCNVSILFGVVENELRYEGRLRLKNVNSSSRKQSDGGK